MLVLRTWERTMPSQRDPDSLVPCSSHRGPRVHRLHRASRHGRRHLQTLGHRLKHPRSQVSPTKITRSI